MRKLTPEEEFALHLLVERGGGSYCPTADEADHPMVKVLHALVKKKRVAVEMTDAGPKFHAA